MRILPLMLLPLIGEIDTWKHTRGTHTFHILILLTLGREQREEGGRREGSEDSTKLVLKVFGSFYL